MLVGVVLFLRILELLAKKLFILLSFVNVFFALILVSTGKRGFTSILLFSKQIESFNVIGYVLVINDTNIGGG